MKCACCHPSRRAQTRAPQDEDRSEAIATHAPVALILSPLLTGGKVFEK
jgi:hypothetical protein